MIFQKVRAKNIITNSTSKWSIRARLVFWCSCSTCQAKISIWRATSFDWTISGKATKIRRYCDFQKVITIYTTIHTWAWNGRFFRKMPRDMYFHKNFLDFYIAYFILDVIFYINITLKLYKSNEVSKILSKNYLKNRFTKNVNLAIFFTFWPLPRYIFCKFVSKKGQKPLLPPHPAYCPKKLLLLDLKLKLKL